ncbi:hypothetical protein GF318_05755 [Candidatus Micrarchaeota archaeon]|nr:hypothetical protein [Candidatus Micrarchaeota archaeon]
MSELICPKCGRSSDEIEFIEAFCVDCYPAKVKCPRKLEIEQCRKCGKIRIRGEWIPFSRERISEYVVSKCRGEFDGAEYLTDMGVVRFAIQGKKHVERYVEVELKGTMCTYCSRISGGYFEGIIQLRGNPKRIEKYANMLADKLEKRTFITKAEDKHGGLDIFVGSSKAVVELISELRLKADITRKLVGVKHGKKLYRTTFLIRL